MGGPAWPPALSIVVNGDGVPGVYHPQLGHVRREQVFNLTKNMKPRHNNSNAGNIKQTLGLLDIEWTSKGTLKPDSRTFLVAAVLTKPVTDKELLQSLHTPRNESVQLLAAGEERVRSICMQQQHDGDELAVVEGETGLVVRLACPLSGCRIQMPVIGRWCKHLQCFDAS